MGLFMTYNYIVRRRYASYRLSRPKANAVATFTAATSTTYAPPRAGHEISGTAVQLAALLAQGHLVLGVAEFSTGAVVTATDDSEVTSDSVRVETVSCRHLGKSTSNPYLLVIRGSVLTDCLCLQLAHLLTTIGGEDLTVTANFGPPGENKEEVDGLFGRLGIQLRRCIGTKRRITGDMLPFFEYAEAHLKNTKIYQLPGDFRDDDGLDESGNNAKYPYRQMDPSVIPGINSYFHSSSCRSTSHHHP